MSKTYKNNMQHKVIFCNVAYMKNYDSFHFENDIPTNGGVYVKETKDALEKNNFHYCVDGYVRGFVETKYKDGFITHKQPNNLHIEKIDLSIKKEDEINGVTVIFCAKHPNKEKRTVIVGWYHNATVYRTRKLYHDRQFNLKTTSNNAFLLLEDDRNFEIPRASRNENNIGFGQSNIWYANKPEHKEFVKKVIDYIDKESRILDKKIKLKNEIEDVEQEEDSKIQKEINNTVLDTKNHFEYTKEIKPRPKQIKKGKVIYYKRNAKVSANALNRAYYKCEINNDHKTFLRKKDEISYTEAHHLIPMSQQDKFEFSLDIEENIISLCSNCHNEIHYGKNQNDLLEKLFNERKDLLKSKGIEINLEELLSFYS